MKATLTPFIDLVVHGQALYSLLLISRVVPGTEVRHLGGGGGVPSSAYPPCSPHILSYLLLLSIILSVSPCVFPMHN